MSYGVSWAIKEIKRTITKVIECGELPDAKSIGTLEIDLTKLSSTIASPLMVGQDFRQAQLTCSHSREWAILD